MRVRNNSSSAVRSDSVRVGSSGSVERAATTSSSAAPRAARLDVATIMGIPEAELTPKVRAAIDQLIAEVHNLREDLGQARKRVDFLENLADKDPLVPVMNRRAFVRELVRMIAFAERYGVSGSVLYFDVNGMKQINDTHGHGAGDAVLKHVADELLRGIRASDVAGRLGGDEFGIVLAQASPAAAVEKAGSLAAAVAAEPVQWNGQALPVTLSFGAYTFAGGEAVDDALSAADQAMYAQKRDSDAPAAKD